MSYAAWSVIFGEQPSATKWNILGTNDAAFNDGTGIGDGAINIDHLDTTVFFPGFITPYGGSGAPTGWLLCDGSAISRSTYSALFAVLGTAYGAGNGTTTFNIPNLQGRIPVGLNGATFNALGATGGAETHTLTTAQMPTHTHTGTTSSDSHSHTISNNVIKTGSATSGLELGAIDDATWGTSTTSSDSHSHTFTTASAGSGASHNNLQPYQVTNYLVKH